MEIKLLLVLCYFNPRTPRGVRLAADAPTPPHPCISIHAPREGCDTAIAASYTPLDLFQSTHPARGATCAEHCDRHPCGISIHAPREGCDVWAMVPSSMSTYFNPRTPRGVRRSDRPPERRNHIFQSTHPARGATGCSTTTTPSQTYFNPRTPRGVRHLACARHATHSIFQSTHPARGATAASWPLQAATPYFNPRTPRGVRPTTCSSSSVTAANFNPRTPRGVRQQTLPKSREFAWLNLLICTRGRRLSIQKQTRLCSIKLSFMLFGCEPAGEGVSSWTSHATKSKVRLEGRSA